MKVEILREGGWQEVPLPPIPGSLDNLKAVRVSGRLAATRSGRNYHWLARGFKIPSSARHEPRVALEFWGSAGILFLGWHQPATLEPAPEGYPALSWGGTLVDAPALVWGWEVLDMSVRWARGRLVRAALDAADGQAPLHQGGLTARPVPPLEELAAAAGLREAELEDIIRQPQRPVKLGYHAVFARRVVGYDWHRLIEVADGREGVVTSPDHPFEPLRLGKGWWLLSHPVPSRGKD